MSPKEQFYAAYVSLHRDKTLTDSPIDSKKKSNYQPPPPIQDESRRKFLREVEVKVMRFVDKLEQRGGTRSGLNIQAEAEKFRQQLIDVSIICDISMIFR